MKIALRRTDTESCVTEYTSVYDINSCRLDADVATELRDAAKEYERVNLTVHEGMPLVTVRLTSNPDTHLG